MSVVARGGVHGGGFRVESGGDLPAGFCLLSGMGVGQVLGGQAENAGLENKVMARGGGTVASWPLLLSWPWPAAWAVSWSRQSG